MRIGPLNFIIASFLMVAFIKMGEIVISSDLVAKTNPPTEQTKKEEAPKTPEKKPEEKKAEGSVAASPETATSTAHANAPAQGSGACLTGELLQSARDKLAMLEKKQQEVDERTRLMEVAEQRVQEQLARLEAAKDKISEAAQSAEAKMSKDNTRLMVMYEQMKAKDAAEIFNEMDAQVAANLLRSMKEQKSSQILAAMEPKKAYEVTVMLASHLKRDAQKIKEVLGDTKEAVETPAPEAVAGKQTPQATTN